MTYYRQLDSLRCIAVFIVIFHHLPIFPQTNYLGFYFHNITGVDIFFVLSGFLITNILLVSKYKGIPMGRALKTFYIRRFFRIFPIYYLTILFLVIVNPANYRDYFIYDLLYISNIKMGLDGHFPTVSPHFWSLAVEEQYYLLAPLMVFITPVKRMIWVLSGITFLGLVSFFVFKNTSYEFLASRTVINLLYLGAGGVLAYIFINHKKTFAVLGRSALLVLFLYTVLVTLAFFELIDVPFNLMFFIKFVFCVFMVVKFTVGFTGFFGKFFGSGILVYLGKISYGLYLYHFLMVIPLAFINKLSVRMLDYDMMSNLYLANFYKVILTVVVASLSWKLVEIPMSRLKEKFSYQ